LGASGTGKWGPTWVTSPSASPGQGGHFKGWGLCLVVQASHGCPLGWASRRRWRQAHRGGGRGFAGDAGRRSRSGVHRERSRGQALPESGVLVCGVLTSSVAARHRAQPAGGADAV